MVTPVRKVPLHLQSAANRLHIKNGVVVNDDGEEQMDIYIEVTHKETPCIILNAPLRMGSSARWGST